MAGGDGSTAGSDGNIVRQWLYSLGLPQYYQAFYDNGYDELEICKAIGPADLEAIGVSCAEHQSALLASVRTMREEGATAVYFTLEPPAAAAEAFKTPTGWQCPPPDQQPPLPPHPPLPTTSNDGDKYAEGKTALAHGGDLSGIAAAIATAAWSLSESAAVCERSTFAVTRDVADDDRARLCVRTPQFSNQSTPSASPAHFCHHHHHQQQQQQQQLFSKPPGRGSTSEISHVGGGAAATPSVRTVEHTCGRGGSVRVPAAGTAALSQQWQHRRQQRSACCCSASSNSSNSRCEDAAMRHAHHRCHLHPSSAPVTPAHVASAAPTCRTSGGGGGGAALGIAVGGAQQQQQQQQLHQQHRNPNTAAAAAATASALTHEERMKVLCDVTQGQLSVGEAVALLNQKRSSKPPAKDDATAIASDASRGRLKKATEKRTTNFLKLLSFRKNKKSQSQEQEHSEKKSQSKLQQPFHHDAITATGDSAPKNGRSAGKPSAHASPFEVHSNHGLIAAPLHGAGATGSECAHMPHAACSGCVASSSAVKWTMSHSQMSGRGRLLSYDGAAGGGGGSTSTSSGSLTSVAGLGGPVSNGCCGCSHGDRVSVGGVGGSNSSRGSGVGSPAAAAAAAAAAGRRSGVPTPRHNFFYSPQVTRRHYDPEGRRWTEDGDDDDDSVWLSASGAGVAAAVSTMTMRAEGTAGSGRRRLPARSPTVDFTGSCSVADHVGFEHVDQRKRDSGCYGSGDCLHPRTSVGGGSTNGGHLKLSVSSSSSLSSRDSCSTAAAIAAASLTGTVGSDAAASTTVAPAVALLAADRCCSSDRLDGQRCHHHRQFYRGDVPSMHHEAGSVSSLSAAPSHGGHRRGSSSMQPQHQAQHQVQLTQLFRGLDLDVALRLQQHGINLHDSLYTTPDGRWSVPPAVVMRLAQEVAIEAQEACAILDRVRVKLLAAVGKPAVALEMSFQGPKAATVAGMMRQQQQQQAKPATVCDFLFVAGLPGYEGLLALHGYDTIDLVAAMTQDDIRRCGISDVGHIHTLLSLARELLPRPQTGGRAASGHCPSSTLVGMS